MHTQEPEFVSQGHMRNLGIVVNICNPSTGDRQILEAYWPSSLAKSVKPRLNVRPCLTKHCGEWEKDTQINFLHPQACTHTCMWSPTCAKMFIHYTYKLVSKLYHKNFTQENLNLRLWLSRDRCLLYGLRLIKRRLESSQWEWDSLCESALVSLESWTSLKLKCTINYQQSFLQIS